MLTRRVQRHHVYQEDHLTVLRIFFLAQASAMIASALIKDSVVKLAEEPFTLGVVHRCYGVMLSSHIGLSFESKSKII